MSRSFGRILSSIWDDVDFIALPQGPQRLYLFLLSQPDLSHAGLIPLRIRKWARKSADLDADALLSHLAALVETRFVVVDHDTEELLVRTLVRGDGIYRQPKVMIRLREDAAEMESPLLRRAFIAEISRLPLDELSTEPTGRSADGPSTRESVGKAIEGVFADFQDVLKCPPETLPDTHPDTPHVRGRVFPQPPSPVPQPPAPLTSTALAPLDAAPPRPDVDALCTKLADHIEANGSKRPNITGGWRDAARLMLDRDGRTFEQVVTAIEWCQRDEFWRANILSMPKLREKYDQLRLQAVGTRRTRQQETDDMFSRAAKRMGVVQ